jgi:hypothetical protein
MCCSHGRLNVSTARLLPRPLAAPRPTTHLAGCGCAPVTETANFILLEVGTDKLGQSKQPVVNLDWVVSINNSSRALLPHNAV